MKILDIIKEPYRKAKAKHTQKVLIKTDDDKLVVKALSADEDNSAIDIHAVIKNMDNPENMAEVVENNLEELIEQDNVKSAMKYLNDGDILRILNENNKELVKNKKIKLAIEAIESNDKKIKAIVKNAASLNDCELSKILETLKPEKQEKRKAELEEQKISIVSKRILRHIINNGGAWHLKELTETLEENSKLSVAERCLETISEYEKDRDKKKHITSSAKVRLVVDLFELTNLPYATKEETLINLLDKGLTSGEIKEIQDIIEQERVNKGKEELKKQARLRNERLKRGNLGLEEHEYIGLK